MEIKSVERLKGWSASLKIDHQTFYLSEKETKDEADWMGVQLRVAIEKLLKEKDEQISFLNLQLKNLIDNIELDNQFKELDQQVINQFAAEFAEWKDKNFTMLVANDRALWYKEKGKTNAPISINGVFQLFKQSKQKSQA